ncbi:helix-turn-helix transcriptional regulator [Pseudonocardia sp. MH-G8]|uniref:helix-turn-helix transcriptional regulator n=1 Tax=Pseudonocardia sp. MH-G8 TaxID=1854588 RepID=UPI0018E929ED|nr:helix-turn-helix transcriptional regulator [Pseudonocardia sp. MH-G8]
MTTQTDSDAKPLDVRAELSEFLRTRRARLQPGDVGVQAIGRRRRVPGLRREELAQLAGVSVAYYTRLEQGNGRNVSTEVLEAIATALRLDESERAHLFHLAKPQPTRRRQPTRPQRVRPEVAEMLDVLEGTPAYVWGRRTDVLAWNRAAAALFGRWFERSSSERNWTRIVFLTPEARSFFVDWNTKASQVVGQLRLDAGMNGNDPQLSSLVGEASLKSDEFRRLWAAHDVKRQSHGQLRINHEAAGELLLHYETLMLPDDQDQAVTVYRTEPGAARKSLRFLINSTASAGQE